MHETSGDELIRKPLSTFMFTEIRHGLPYGQNLYDPTAGVAKDDETPCVRGGEIYSRYPKDCPETHHIRNRHFKEMQSLYYFKIYALRLLYCVRNYQNLILPCF